MITDFGHWVNCTAVNVEELPYGFIYLIENKVTNKKYIGKKQIKSIKKLKPLKGKKNKRHFDVETDWKTYTSSSNDVNSDIEKYGKDNFSFSIIKFCDSKSELSYFEAKLQFEENVLLREDYYNGIINLRIGKNCFVKKLKS
jgi:hypothetical protein